jgi:hypothetical protein
MMMMSRSVWRMNVLLKEEEKEGKKFCETDEQGELLYISSPSM